jgi:hypothetical protein
MSICNFLYFSFNEILRIVQQIFELTGKFEYFSDRPKCTTQKEISSTDKKLE